MCNKNGKNIYGLNEKIVFFVLLGILLIPSVFFIAQSYFQLNNVLLNINQTIKLNTSSILTGPAVGKDHNILTILSRVSLEHDVMMIRHQRATAFLATRTWMRFMSLNFGAILVVIGSGFVLGKISSPEFKGEFTYEKIGASIATSSPGLVLVFCGMVLIAIPNLSSQRIDTDDTSSYIDKGHFDTEDKASKKAKVVNEIREKFKL